MASPLQTNMQSTDGKAVLLGLINVKENTSKTLDSYVFLAPEKPVSLLPVRNTKIKLAPVAATGTYRVSTIWYNRIHVSDLGVLNVQPATATTVVGVLPLINNKYSLQLMAVDIVDDPLPTHLPDGSVNIDLVFQDTSIIFYSGTRIVTAEEAALPMSGIPTSVVDPIIVAGFTTTEAIALVLNSLKTVNGQSLAGAGDIIITGGTGTAVSDPDVNSVDYAYDNLDRLITVTEHLTTGDRITTHIYNSKDLPITTAVSFGGVTKTMTYTYNAKFLLASTIIT
jgi:hypothetical protein